MPLYFFDIIDGHQLPDRQGLDLKDVGEAQAHAISIAVTFLNQAPTDVWRENYWSVSIREKAQATLFRLDVRVSQGENPESHMQGVFS